MDPGRVIFGGFVYFSVSKVEMLLIARPVNHHPLKPKEPDWNGPRPVRSPSGIRTSVVGRNQFGE